MGVPRLYGCVVLPDRLLYAPDCEVRVGSVGPLDGVVYCSRYPLLSYVEAVDAERGACIATRARDSVAVRLTMLSLILPSD